MKTSSMSFQQNKKVNRQIYQSLPIIFMHFYPLTKFQKYDTIAGAWSSHTRRICQTFYYSTFFARCQ